MISHERWIPDNPDGSGWADVDWASTIRGSRYHYQHGLPFDEAVERLPSHYLVMTRLESAELEPHENSYFVPRELLADFLMEVALAAGAEKLWHIEPCNEPPAESNVSHFGE